MSNIKRYHAESEDMQWYEHDDKVVVTVVHPNELMVKESDYESLQNQLSIADAQIASRDIYIKTMREELERLKRVQKAIDTIQAALNSEIETNH